MKLFAKINNGFVTIFAKSSILDVCLNTPQHLKRHFQNVNKKVGPFNSFQ